MDATPAVPGNDASVSGFEGFANKEASKGAPIFPAKNEPQAITTTSPPADNTTFRVNKRKGGTTTAGYVKSIGD